MRAQPAAAAHVDVSMTDGVLAHAIMPLLGLLDEGRAPARGSTMLSGGLACYNVYATSDGRFMAVGALEKKFWEALCDALGCPQLKPAHLDYGDAGRAARQHLAGIFAAKTQGQSGSSTLPKPIAA